MNYHIIESVISVNIEKSLMNAVRFETSWYWWELFGASMRHIKDSFSPFKFDADKYIELRVHPFWNKNNGGPDGIRTRDLRRDRPAF